MKFYVLFRSLVLIDLFFETDYLINLDEIFVVMWVVEMPLGNFVSDERKSCGEKERNEAFDPVRHVPIFVQSVCVVIKPCFDIHCPVLIDLTWVG